MRSVLVLMLCLFTLMCFGCKKAEAVDLGKGFSADLMFTGGKLWDTETKDDMITLNSEDSDWYVKAEAGIKYSWVRAFGRYEKMNEVYDWKECGIDVYPVAFAGIRTSYNYLKAPGFITNEFMYTGIILRY